MSSIADAGHAKNAANFEDLISFCTGYGAAYNPGNAAIAIAALQARHAAALADIQAVQVARTAYSNATNAREISFTPVRKLATRIVSALAAVAASRQTLDDAKAVNRRIQGKRAAAIAKTVKTATTDAPAADAAPVDKTISVSHQSYDALTESFSRLIEVVAAEPLYTPNEAELTVAGLRALLAQLHAANTAVIVAATAYSNARIVRNTTLYDAATGLVRLSAEVKQYIKSLYGAASPQYRQVGKIAFKVHAA